MQNKINYYNEILLKIKSFLENFKTKDWNILEKDYYSYIEQESEKLLDLNNDGIIDIQIFKKIKDIFTLIIRIINDNSENKREQLYIINDLYFIFKYVYENILFLIENEFLF